MVVDEMQSSMYSTPEKDLRHCYFLRAIQHFLVFLGLANIKPIKSKALSGRQYKIKKMQLLNEVAHFNLVDPDIQKKVNLSVVSSKLH